MSYIEVDSKERGNVSLYVSDNVNLEFFNNFFINQDFQMTTFNLLIFVINNLTVLVVNIMVLIWLQVQQYQCSAHFKYFIRMLPYR